MLLERRWLKKMTCVNRYEHARNAMHEVYKVVRAVSVDALAKDYARFGREHRANIRFEQAGSSELKLACRDGDVQTVRRILSRDSSGCNRTGLAYIAVGHELQDKEAALARGESASALNLRTFWPHRLVDVDVEVSNDTAAALFVACEYSQLECVEEILASAPNLSRSELDEALVPACRSRPTNEVRENIPAIMRAHLELPKETAVVELFRRIQWHGRATRASGK